MYKEMNGACVVITIVFITMAVCGIDPDGHTWKAVSAGCGLSFWGAMIYFGNKSI